jgi:hypothetical protein
MGEKNKASAALWQLQVLKINACVQFDGRKVKIMLIKWLFARYLKEKETK